MSGAYCKSPVTLYKEYEVVKPNINKLDRIIEEVLKDCSDNYFHSYEYRFIFDVDFTDIKKN